MRVYEVTTFGALKAGDRFAYQGSEWVKISGNVADLMMEDEVIGAQDISADAVVVLLELW